jgi:hypothetical protein
MVSPYYRESQPRSGPNKRSKKKPKRNKTCEALILNFNLGGLQSQIK